MTEQLIPHEQLPEAAIGIINIVDQYSKAFEGVTPDEYGFKDIIPGVVMSEGEGLTALRVNDKDTLIAAAVYNDDTGTRMILMSKDYGKRYRGDPGTRADISVYPDRESAYSSLPVGRTTPTTDFEAKLDFNKLVSEFGALLHERELAVVGRKLKLADAAAKLLTTRTQ